MATHPTGLDAALALDAVYYSHPIPQNLAVLTVMGAVFDRVYFPGVYIPKGGYDERDLRKEIDRLKAVARQCDRDSSDLISMLEFVKHARTLDGFCVFTGDGASAFPDPAPEQLARDVFYAISGPQRPGWEPMLHSGHHKAIPGSDEQVSWPGTYHYLAGSLIESGKRGIPLLNDVRGLPIPGIDQAAPRDDAARTLAAVLAIECTKLALPPIPVLRPEQLMEFRAENKEALRAFRRSMLQYAGDLNDKVKGLSPADLERETKFFVHTQIVPVMDELRSSMSDPTRPWYNRVADHVRVVAELGANFFAMDPTAAIAKALANYAGVLGSELTARGDQRQTLKRSGLYYLLSLQRYHEKHGAQS
jgi:hypothetical protein